jgi:hypothetical protein
MVVLDLVMVVGMEMEMGLEIEKVRVSLEIQKVDEGIFLIQMIMLMVKRRRR